MQHKSRINIKIHNLAKTNYTVLFGFLTTNRFCHGKNTCMIIQWWLRRQLLTAVIPLRSYRRQKRFIVKTLILSLEFVFAKFSFLL